MQHETLGVDCLETVVLNRVELACNRGKSWFIDVVRGKLPTVQDNFLQVAVRIVIVVGCNNRTDD